MEAPGYPSVNLRQRANLALLPKLEKEAAERERIEAEFPDKIIAKIEKKEHEILKCADKGKTKFKLHTMKKPDYPALYPCCARLNAYVKQKFGNAAYLDSSISWGFWKCKRVLYLKW